ncbi:MAG: PilW family protein [Opitutales bacterium]
MHRNSHLPRPLRKKGFTLVEIIVTMTILTIVMAGLATFMVDSARGMFWSVNKAKISKDIRLFTLRITKETLGANVGYVYPNYQLANRDDISDRRQSGTSGDCLVLIHTDPYPTINDPKHYNRIVIYYREADEDGVSPVYRVEKTFDPPLPIDTTAGVDHFESFLATHFLSHSPADSEVVLELARGLADGRLFRNVGNNSFVINGEIIHGNEIKEVTNTYNLTISPRG